MKILVYISFLVHLLLDGAQGTDCDAVTNHPTWYTPVPTWWAVTGGINYQMDSGQLMVIDNYRDALTDVAGAGCANLDCEFFYRSGVNLMSCIKWTTDISNRINGRIWIQTNGCTLQGTGEYEYCCTTSFAFARKCSLPFDWTMQPHCNPNSQISKPAFAGYVKTHYLVNDVETMSEPISSFLSPSTQIPLCSFKNC